MVEKFRASVVESNEPMVELSGSDFVVVPVYHAYGWAESPSMWLRSGLVERLWSAQESHLKTRGMKWVVYDAWRSRETQARIYQRHWQELACANPMRSLPEILIELEKYVSSPLRTRTAGAPAHSTGGAVDVGLWDESRGCLVDLDGGFDEFTERAASDYHERAGRGQSFSAQMRQLMAKALADHGVIGDPNEYFHKEYGTIGWARSLSIPQSVYGEAYIENGHCAEAATWRYSSGESVVNEALRLAAIKDLLNLSLPASKPMPLPIAPCALAGKMAKARR